jgi:tetratricopeptide (TPR) repeat protein
MRYEGKKWAIAVGAVAALLVAAPGLALSEEQQRDESLGICTNASPDADRSIEACTRLLDEEAKESARRRAAALTFRALAWQAKGDLEHAAADLTDAIAIDESFAPAYQSRADLLRRLEQCDLALADFDRVIELTPEGAGGAYVGRGFCFIQLKEYDRAIADFDVLIKLDPNNGKGVGANAWGLKGRVHSVVGDLDNSISDYGEAIKLDPKRANFFFNRGSLWAIKGEEDQALADYEQAIKLDESNASGIAVMALGGRAQLDARRNNLDAGLADYEHAIKLDPQRVSLYLGRAGLWVHKGDDEHALADYDRAIEMSPQAMVYNARGDFFRAKGDYERALKDYEKAVENQADYLPAYASRGLVRFYQGEFAKAADDFRRIVASQPNTYSSLLLYLSNARAGRREARDAREELTKAAGKLDAKAWPYPLVELFLGRKSLQTAEAAAEKPEQRCEAQFYIGEWQLLQGAKAQAVKALQSAADTCPKDSVDRRGAVEELKRINVSADAVPDSPTKRRRR